LSATVKEKNNRTEDDSVLSTKQK